MVGSRRFHGNAEYLLDWDAVAAIGSLLAVIAAVVTVVYSVKRPLREQMLKRYVLAS